MAFEHKIKKENVFLSSVKEKIIKPALDKRSFLNYVLFLILMGLAFFAVSLFVNGFTAPMSGDYVVQSIAFFHNGYDDWWHFFKTGEFPFWDNNTFLGADNLSNNAFYYVFNPFFLLITLFPRAWIVQMMAIMMIAKMVLASIFMRLLLKHFKVKETEARIFSMCYGFGGWMLFYTWFNVFMEACTFLPLVLLGIEKVINKEKPYTLMISLFLLSLSNYYFLIPICIFGVIYSLFRLFTTAKNRTVVDNFTVLGIGIVSFMIGLGSAAFLTIPAFTNVLTYPRSNISYLNELKTLLDNGETGEFFLHLVSFDSLDSRYGFRQVYPILSFLFPPTDCRSVPGMMFDGNRYDKVASSLFCYSPCILIFFASIIKSIKDKKYSHLVALLFFICALSFPVFYYMFLGFSDAYGRWEVIPFILIVLYCAISFNKREEYKKWWFDVSYVVTIILMFVGIILSNIYVDIYDKVEPLEWMWIIVGIQFVYITVLYVLFRFHFKKNKFIDIGRYFILAECSLMGVYFYFGHGYTSYFSNNFIGGINNFSLETEIVNEIKAKDDLFYRIQSGRINGSGTNIAMLEGYNGTSIFHSQYNSYIDQFFNWSRISRWVGNWVGESIEKRPLLDTFLGVKYYLTKDVETNWYVNSNKVVHVVPNMPFGYEKMFEKKDYEVYQNTKHINLGFTFDTIVEPNIYDEENNEYRVYSDFYSSRYARESIETLHNDYNYTNTAIIEQDDIDRMKLDYPEAFSSGDISVIPKLNMPLKKLQSYNSKTMKIYRLPSNFDPSDPLAYETVGNIADQNSDIKYANDILVITPSKGSYFNEGDMKDSAFIINKTIDGDHIISYFLIDDKGDVITYDNNYSFTSSGSRYYRHLYTDKLVSRIIAVPHKKMSVRNIKPDNIYLYSESDYNNIIYALNKHPLENVKNSTNTHSFTTNFDKNRIIVLNVPYAPGWSCRINLGNNKYEELDVYKSHGGFLSVVGQVGETKYEFNYVTQYFKGGMVISFASLGGALSFAVYYYIKNKKNGTRERYNLCNNAQSFRNILRSELENTLNNK